MYEPRLFRHEALRLGWLKKFPALPPSVRESRTGLEAFAILDRQRLQFLGYLSLRHGLPSPGERATTERGEPDPIRQCKINLPRMLHDLVIQTAHRFVDHWKKQALVKDVVGDGASF